MVRDCVIYPVQLRKYSHRLTHAGVSNKLLPRHRGVEAERRTRAGSIVELQELGTIHRAV
jgi:hypothetical protein